MASKQNMLRDLKAVDHDKADRKPRQTTTLYDAVAGNL